MNDINDIKLFNETYNPGDCVEVEYLGDVYHFVLYHGAVLSKSGKGFIRVQVGDQLFNGSYSSRVVYLNKVHSPYGN
jgi:hypothetical protein